MSTPIRAFPMVNEVAAPPIQGSATGLTALARFPEWSDERWVAGYFYSPDFPAETAHNRSLITSTVGDNIGDDDIAEDINVIPWMLEIERKRSAFDDNASGAAKASELLEAYTSKLLERELWLGEIAQEDDLPNRYLTQDPTNITGTFNPQQAVAKLAGAMSDAGWGDCMIHVPRRLAILMPDAWRNPQTYEDHGFVVVSGAGYPDTGKIFATEMVNVRLTEIEVREANDSSGFDMRTNTLTYHAQRIGAVDFAGPVFSCTVTT